MNDFERNFGADVQALYNRILALSDLWSGGFARHHVVPLEVARNSDFIREVYGVEAYQGRFNSLENVIVLPVNDADAVGLGMSQHRGNHPDYRAAITRVHEELLDEYQARLTLDPSKELNLKAEYRALHDRVEFQLKQGLVAGFPDGDIDGVIRPSYPPEQQPPARRGAGNNSAGATA